MSWPKCLSGDLYLLPSVSVTRPYSPGGNIFRCLENIKADRIMSEVNRRIKMVPK